MRRLSLTAWIFVGMALLLSLSEDWNGYWLRSAFVAIAVLVHELGHAFIFDRVHSGGVMSDFTLCFVGDHLCANSSVCFQEKDRREIAENKWRDFSAEVDCVEPRRCGKSGGQ